MSDIALTAAQRTSLLSLQRTQSLSERTQTRLSTGRSVNSVTDDAVNFFRARALSDRASDFELRRNDIEQGTSSLNAALTAIDGVDSFLNQLKGIAEAARSQSDTERASATTQFQEVGRQLIQLVEDASYAGLNLLNSTNNQLDVAFGVRTASRLTIDGFDLTSSGSTQGVFGTTAVFNGPNSTGAITGNALNISALSGTTAAIAGFSSIGTNNSNLAGVSGIISSLDSGISRLRGFAAQLGSNVAILQTRLDFTDNYVNELETGSDNLTLADLNEEGANLVALQTRQQLGIQSLSISGQQQQAILGLIG